METKEETVKTHVSLSIIVCVCIFVLSTATQGVVIPLSSHTSDDPNVPASWLDASMDLSVKQVGEDWELTLAVTNLTPEGAGDIAFKISELYFNTSAPITNLTLEEVDGGIMNEWDLTLDMDSIIVGPFGYFDISLISNGQNVEWIEPGDTVSFKMMIEGDAPSYVDTDFYALSIENHLYDKWLGYGAAKFFGGGPDDLSAYGAYVPEPATILLLGLGMLCLLRKRRQ